MAGERRRRKRIGVPACRRVGERRNAGTSNGERAYYMRPIRFHQARRYALRRYAPTPLTHRLYHRRDPNGPH
jgi:hypothetical protein